MKKIILTILFLVICGITYSQTVIRGTITNVDTKEIIDIANISVSEVGKKTMAGYAMVDGKGKYEIKYAGTRDSIVITVSGLNLKKQFKTISNKSQTVNFEMESEAITLNEVKIKPPKIRQSGDTLNFLVDSFTDINDRSIGDVIKKMPGIQIQDDGKILYQDKPINKFYIENMDLLQGRYGVATNNIEAKKVSTVQILENHQPIKALDGKVLSEHAALNLKLKDDAKGVFTANAVAGIGASPLLLSNEIIGMLFAKSQQDIVMYKGDNSGRDISNEINSFYSNESSNMSSAKLLSVQSPNPPSIKQQRHLFNEAHMGSLNDLHKIGKEHTLTTNINYSFDRQEKESNALSEYYLPGDNILTVDETLESILYKSKLGADIQLNANTKKYYLNNLLKFDGEWDRERGSAITDENITQHLRNPVYGISNTFDWTKVGDKNMLKASSFFGYKDISQTLKIQPLLYPDLFDRDTKEGLMQQSLGVTNFSTRNTFSWGRTGKFTQEYKIEFKAEIQHLETDLQGIVNNNSYSADSLQNDLQWNKFEWIFSPGYSYDINKKMTIRTGLPLRYVLLHKNDVLGNGRQNSDFIYIDPSLMFNYKISPFWSTMLNYNYSNSIGGIRDAYTGYVMTSYRNLLRNDELLTKGRNHSLVLYLNYKNPLTTLFANGYINYQNIYSNLLNDYVYQGILRVKSSIERPNTREYLNLGMRIGKDIDAINTTFSIGNRYSYTRSSQLSQGIVSDYQSRYFAIYPSITTRLKNIANIDYTMNIAWSKSEVESSENKLPNIRTMSQKITLNASPIKKLTASISFENFYNNSIQSGSRSMWFGDLGLKYKLKDVEFTVDYTNIFNTKKYTSTSYSDIGRYYYSYNLRPAEVLFRVRFKLK